jgi:TrmH family RNA methyltransferase
MRIITSRHNPVVRTFRAVASEADLEGSRLLLDGAHLVREAHASGSTFDVVAVAASRLDGDTEEAALAKALEARGVDVVSAPDPVFAAMSPVRRPSGIVAIVRRQPSSAADIWRHESAFVVAAADVQDPGNLGALLRAAEAGGATAVMVCGESASPFSWKALRGSMGSALRVPVLAGLGIDAALECLKRSGARTIAAVPRDGGDPDSLDWRGRVGLLLGGEGPGLPGHIAAACDARVTIPMNRPVESLNVAVAGAILVYAARRQRT